MRHLILVCVAGDLLWMHSYMVAAVPLEHFYPITESVAFLQKQSERIAGIGGALLPNASVVYRIPDIRGYDPMVSARFANAYKKLSGVQSLLLQPIRNWTHPLLDQLSVRWVLSPPKQPAPVDDWRLAFQGQDARVYERVTALPMVRWSRNQGNESSESQRISVQKSSSQFTVVEQVPGRWVIDWSCTDSNRLEICEIFHEGWYASNDGRPVSVEPVEDLIIGIPLQAGHGRIRLEFWPPGLNLGLLVSSLALLVFATGWLLKLGKFR